MADDSEDDFDYLSDLKHEESRRKSVEPLTAHHEVITLDSDSDNESDNKEEGKDVSDKLIADIFGESDEDIKIDNPVPNNDVNSNAQLVSPSTSDAPPKLTPQESKPSEHKMSSELSNTTIESKPVIKTESSDVKPDIKPNLDFVKQEIKPNLKLELNDAKEEDSSCSGSIKSVDSSVDNSNDNNQYNKSDIFENSDGYRALLDAILRVKSFRQRPTFDRILVSYKKLKTSVEATPILVLRSLIDTALKKGLIEAVEPKDGGSTAYLPIGSCNNYSTVESHPNKQFENCEDVTNKKDASTNLDFEMQSDKEGDTNVEISPEMLSSSLPNGNDDNTSSSPLLISVPINSSNNKRNREVIRKTVPSTCNPGEVKKVDHQRWLLEELPRYTPFIGQKGDRVVYLRDAHEIYVKNELRELSELYSEFDCDVHQINAAIGEDKYIVKAIVSKVKFFQNNFLRFSILELKNVPEDSAKFCFNVLYRPHIGVNDFLVLEKFFNQSLTRIWNKGEEFRSLYKKSWWIGKITGKSVYDQNYPDSPFKCYEVEWNTGEKGQLSPWDLFEVDPERLPKRLDNGILINRDDLLSINYKPYLNEWPKVENLDFQKWRYHELKRIYCGIKTVERLVHSSVLNLLEVPQNEEISYPIHLKLIKKRLKNLFYRRKDAVITEIETLKTNAKLYIEPKYLQYGEDMVSLLLVIANDTDIIKPEQVKDLLVQYPNLINGIPERIRSQNESNGDRKRHNSQSSSTSSSKKHKKTHKKDSSNAPNSHDSQRRTSLESQSSVEETVSEQWKTDIQKFIDEILKKPESEPYRQPVDPEAFPYYKTVIDEPIDISEIQKKLNTNVYRNPKEVRTDFRLMYANAKAFNKNPKSLVRQYNKMLEKFTEDKLREIIVDWTRVYNYEQKKKNSNGSLKPREPISRNQLWGYGAQQYY